MSIEEMGFQVDNLNNIRFLGIRLARIEDDKSLTLFVKQNSTEANTLKLDLLISELGNPVINNAATAEKKVTSVMTDTDTMKKCKQKYGSLSKALEFAANYNKI